LGNFSVGRGLYGYRVLIIKGLAEYKALWPLLEQVRGNYYLTIRISYIYINSDQVARINAKTPSFT